MKRKKIVIDSRKLKNSSKPTVIHLGNGDVGIGSGTIGFYPKPKAWISFGRLSKKQKIGSSVQKRDSAIALLEFTNTESIDVLQKMISAARDNLIMAKTIAGLVQKKKGATRDR